MGRLLQFEIFRYNPEDKESAPHMQTFVMEETTNMTLFIALNRLREEQDPGLIFDFCCRAGICGACAMVINKDVWASLSPEVQKAMTEVSQDWIAKHGKAWDMTCKKLFSR